MHQFIAAMRQFRRPIVLLAVGIVVLQTLVAGLASAAARVSAFGVDIGVICHGNSAGDDPAAPSSDQAGHDCCIVCTAAGPVALSPGAAVLERLTLHRSLAPLNGSRDIQLVPRAIRAGPSQAPPAIA